MFILIISMWAWANLFLLLLFKLGVIKINTTAGKLLFILVPALLLVSKNTSAKATLIDRLAIQFINLLDYLRGDYNKN